MEVGEKWMLAKSSYCPRQYKTLFCQDFSIYLIFSKIEKLLLDEQALKKRLLESQSGLELHKSESSMKMNNLENHVKKLNLEVEILSSKLIEEQNEKEVSRYSSLAKINDYNSQVWFDFSPCLKIG